MHKPIQRFHAWLKDKALRTQSTLSAVSSGLTEPLDPPPYDDLPVKPAPAATITAINAAVCAAATAARATEVSLIAEAVAASIGSVARAVASLPPADVMAAATATAIRTAVPKVALNIAEAQVMRPRPLDIPLVAALEAHLDIIFAVPAASRGTVSSVFPKPFLYAAKSIHATPVLSAPAVTAVLESALLHVVNSVISTPALSRMAVADAYGDYAGRIARDIAQGIVATSLP